LHPSERRALLLTADLILVNAAVLAALALWAWRSSATFSTEYLLSQGHWFLFLSALWLAMAAIVGLYSPGTATEPRMAIYNLFWTMALSLFAYLILYFVSPRNALPRLFILYFAVFGFASLTAWRLAHAWLFSHSAFARRTLVVGAGWAGRTIAQAIRELRNPTYQLLGFVDDDPVKHQHTIAGLPVLGTHQDLLRLVQAHQVSDIILAITGEIHGELLQALMDCHEQGISIIPMADLYEEITGRIAVEHLGNHWHVMLPLDHPGTHSVYPVLKRAMDIVVATAGLVIFGLMLPFIAVAVYLDSPGPIFYTQERIGKGGRPFRVYKIRTMRPNAEENGAVWATENDPRVTRVGRILRKASLDELPQFLNVLRGEMSIVGPRPERPVFVRQLARELPFYRLRHSVKPGMAGWALIHYGYTSSVEDALVKLQYDLYYIKHQSLRLDLYILLRTLGRMLSFQGR
jgi:exopolysaccharide biosynthesis polyprenyl glycosylphosphotransferase